MVHRSSGQHFHADGELATPINNTHDPAGHDRRHVPNLVLDACLDTTAGPAGGQANLWTQAPGRLPNAGGFVDREGWRTSPANIQQISAEKSPKSPIVKTTSMKTTVSDEGWSPVASPGSCATASWPVCPQAHFAQRPPVDGTTMAADTRGNAGVPNQNRNQDGFRVGSTLPTLLAGPGHQPTQAMVANQGGAPCLFVQMPFSFLAMPPNSPSAFFPTGDHGDHAGGKSGGPVPVQVQPEAQRPGSMTGEGSEGLSSCSSTSFAQEGVGLKAKVPKATAIAQLQEYLQSPQRSVNFRFPPGAKVLQWAHSEQRTEEGYAIFRAVLSFYCDGVGHHTTGVWERSKKHARQSAAEVTIALLRGKWVPQSATANARAFVDLARVVPVMGTRAAGPAAEADVQVLSKVALERADLRLDRSEPTKPIYDAQQASASSEWSAVVELPVHGVLHAFSGPLRATKEAACAEVARRALWYLRVVNFERLYLPDSSEIIASGCVVPDPTPGWAKAAEVDVRFRQKC